MKTLYMAWQDPMNRRWLPVGRLTYEGNVYRFVYTKGAQESSNFEPFARMGDLHTIYESSELFPIFANRILPKSRPEYKQYLEWLDLPENQSSPLLVLAVSGGARGTDSLELFACPEPNLQGLYEARFFGHGISHLTQQVIDLVGKLERGSRLFLMPDVQNPVDSFAIALRTDDPATIVGYCPRYLTDDFHKLLQACRPESVLVVVDKVNVDAPVQFRLLCKITSPWPEDFEPCSTEFYQSVAA
jgi:hypothetical protein